MMAEGTAVGSGEPLIETQEVCRYFRRGTAREVRAVDGISLAIPGGSFVALTGPSGSGKTSLLSLLGLLDRPTGGAVRLAGEDCAAHNDYALARLRRRLGFVFQDFALLPRLSAVENVAYGLLPRGGGRVERIQTARQWLQHVGLDAQQDSRPGELSGGECQRVALARALACDPEILMMDEPTSNLDEDNSGHARALLQEEHHKGKTLIVSTHDSQLLDLATHVFELQGGKLVSSSS